MNWFNIFKKENTWLSVEKDGPPEHYKIVWGKFYKWYGLVMYLPNGGWIHAYQNATEPYIYINVDYWKVKL